MKLFPNPVHLTIMSSSPVSLLEGISCCTEILKLGGLYVCFTDAALALSCTTMPTPMIDLLENDRTYCGACQVHLELIFPLESIVCLSA